MVRTFIIASIILIFVSNISTQTDANTKENKLLPQIELTLIEAKTLKPELTIDASLEFISNGKINDRKRLKQILEELFYLSFNVKEKFRKQVVPFEGQALTNQETFISHAHRNKIDALSLQVRIVSELLKIDSKKALELFGEISPNLNAVSLSCNEFLLYEFSGFYKLLEKIAKNNFTQKQINENERIIFLSKYIEDMTSPSQVLPISNLLLELDLTENELNNLVSIFNNSLRKISNEDRAFSYEMNFRDVNKSFFELSRKLYSFAALNKDLLNSYRQYLVNNLQGNRCQDNVNYEQGTTDSERMLISIKSLKLPRYVIKSNEYLFKDNPINIDEIEHFEFNKVDFPQDYFTKGESAKTLKSIRDLQYWKDNEQTASEEKETVEWQTTFSATIDKIESLDVNDDENEIDVFFQKANLYMLLFSEKPKLSLRETIVHKYLKLLNNKKLQRENILEWFSVFKDLHNEINSTKDVSEREVFIDILKNSNINAIDIYLRLEALGKSESKNLHLPKNEKELQK